MTVRIAFFGAGEQALPWLKVLRQCPEAQIIGTCDPMPLLAERLATEWGARAFPTAPEMLAETCPDVLWCCAPAPLQGDVLLRAAEQRIAFFVDPPGAADLEKAQKIDQSVRESGLVTSVGYDAPYRDVTAEAKEYLGDSPIPLALGWWICPGERESLQQLLWNDAARVISVMRWFAGEVKQVQCFSASEKVILLQLEFVTGTVGTFTISTFAHPNPRISLELMGEGWSLTFTDDFGRLSVVEPDKTTILKSLRDPREDHARAFLEAVATGNPQGVRSSYPEILNTLRTCQVAWNLIASKQPKTG